jgi:hypothetical protein
MKRFSAIIGAALVGVGLAACSAKNPAAVPESARPRFDGGYMVGSGNRSDTGGATSSTTQCTTCSNIVDVTSTAGTLTAADGTTAPK